MSLQEKINDAFVNFDIIDQMVKGDKDTMVTTPGGQLPSLAKLSANIVGYVADSLTTTSSSSATLSVGQKTFQIESGKNFVAGMWVTGTCAQGVFAGLVMSQNGRTLVIDVRSFNGTGTGAAWSIVMSGAPGPTGERGQTVQGEQGEQGVPGEKGEKGEQGPAGTGGGGTGVAPTLLTKFAWE